MRRYFRFSEQRSEYISTKHLIRVYVDVQSNNALNEFPRSEKCPRIRIHIFEKEILFFTLIWPGTSTLYEKSTL